jgi:hypothetical protein
MRNRVWVKPLAAALLVLVAGISFGWAMAPMIHQQRFAGRGRLVGQLGAVHFRSLTAQGCDAEPARAVAFQVYTVERLAQQTLARLVSVPVVQAVPVVQVSCVVLATRFGRNLIVNAGETFLRDAWINTVELEIMKYHGDGVGTTAAAEGDTALVTEATTSHNPDNTRATGSLTNNGANVFRTIGTNTFDASAAITEWGLFSQSATGGGTLWSRVVFSAINVASGDSIQYTYDLTIE